MIAIGQLFLTHRVQLRCSGIRAFDLITAGGLPGWQLVRGRELEPGAPICLPLKLPDSLGGQSVNVLGRVQTVQWPHRVVVRQSLPWRGAISLVVKHHTESRCEVRIVTRLDEDALRWTSRHLNIGPPPSLPNERVCQLGVLTSASGPASVFSAASVDLATLAMEEINAEGGVHGRQLEIVVGDDGTHPGFGAAELVRLAGAGCRIVVTNVTSRTFRRLRPVARRLGILLVYAALNEGGTPGAEVVRLGERPSGQLAAAVPAIMRTAAGTRWFLAGSDYCWPWAANRAARRTIQRFNGHIAGQAYMPFGSKDFSSVIDAIKRSGADLVLSTFVGSDEVAFEQQAHASGLRDRVQTLSLALDESTHDYIGPQASEGLWSAFAYFQHEQSTENSRFLHHYRQRFGDAAAPVSSLSESLYEGIHLVARAALTCGSIEPQEVAEQLRQGITYHGPRGLVRTSWRGVRQTIFVAQSQAGILTPVMDFAGPPAGSWQRPLGE
ncbi:substrate-binding protein [Nocardia xishanensis]